MQPKEIINILNTLLDEEISLDEESTIMDYPQIDSMVLVQLCIALEDIANKEGFNFDWTSEKAMSKLNSIFKSPKTLSEEFNRQKKI